MSCQFDENLYTEECFHCQQTAMLTKTLGRKVRRPNLREKNLKIPACIVNCQNHKIIINLSPRTHVQKCQYLDQTDVKTNLCLHIDRVCHSVKRKNFGIKLRHQHKQDTATWTDSSLSSCQGQIVFVVIWVQLSILKIKIYKEC